MKFKVLGNIIYIDAYFIPEDEKCPIPTPTPQNSIERNPDDICTLVYVDTLKYRAATDTRAVRKNVSLPAWMVTLADRMELNCSQILQEALRKKFNIEKNEKFSDQFLSKGHMIFEILLCIVFLTTISANAIIGKQLYILLFLF